jgi:hypothetical protein
MSRSARQTASWNAVPRKSRGRPSGLHAVLHGPDHGRQEHGLAFPARFDHGLGKTPPQALQQLVRPVPELHRADPGVRGGQEEQAQPRLAQGVAHGLARSAAPQPSRGHAQHPGAAVHPAGRSESGLGHGPLHVPAPGQAVGQDARPAGQGVALGRKSEFGREPALEMPGREPGDLRQLRQGRGRVARLQGRFQRSPRGLQSGIVSRAHGPLIPRLGFSNHPLLAAFGG